MDRFNYLRHKRGNLFQSILLIAGMTGLLGLLGWVLAGSEGLLWAVMLGGFTLLFSPRLSPEIILRLYGGRLLTRYQAPDLYQALEEIARRAELPGVPRLYYVHSQVLNAFAVGKGDDVAIALSDGLLRTMELRELAGILAHEVSHIRNNDMWVMGLADTVSRVTGLLSLAGQFMLLFALPMLLLGRVTVPLFPLMLLVFAPTLSALLQLALSRTREFDADLEAARLTGDPLGLANALARMERVQGNWLERIFLPGHRVPDPSLLRTHPPTEERIRRLLSLESQEPSLQGLGWSRGHRHPFPTVPRKPRWHHLHGLWY